MEIYNLTSKDVWDYENGFYWFSDTSRLKKAVAHYEIYRKILSLPGDIAEFGVFKAASLIRFATYRDMLENSSGRQIIGFDAFGKFPHAQDETQTDDAFIKHFEASAGDGLVMEDVQSVMQHKGFDNVKLIEGDVTDTLHKYLTANAEKRFALVHLDMDVHAPTIATLEAIWERIVPGGLVVVDDYNAVAGATEAVDEFVNSRDIMLEKNPFYAVPSYFIKR